MPTDRTRNRLAARGLQVRRLGGAIPQWELHDPQRSVNVGSFTMPQEKVNRIKAKAANARTSALDRFDTRDTSAFAPEGDTNFTRTVRVGRRGFFGHQKKEEQADFGKFVPYINKLSGHISKLKKQGYYEAMTPEEASKITGIPLNKANSGRLVELVMALAENPEALQSESTRKAINGALLGAKGATDANRGNSLFNDTIEALIKRSSLTPELKKNLEVPNEDTRAEHQAAVSRYRDVFANREAEQDTQRRAAHWEEKHQPQAEEEYVEGLLGSKEGQNTSSDYYKKGQTERNSQGLDAYLAAGKATPSAIKKAKHKTPDLFDAGAPQGEQTPLKERELLEEPTPDFSDIKEPVKPDFDRILDPEEKKKAIEAYNAEMDQFDHELHTRDLKGSFIRDFNDRIASRNKAMKKERQQLLGEAALEDKLKTEKMFLRDKINEYKKEKYKQKKEKKTIGAHDFWNVARSGGTKEAPDSFGTLGGINASLALANHALRSGSGGKF